MKEKPVVIPWEELHREAMEKISERSKYKGPPLSPSSSEWIDAMTYSTRRILEEKYGPNPCAEIGEEEKPVAHSGLDDMNLVTVHEGTVYFIFKGGGCSSCSIGETIGYEKVKERRCPYIGICQSLAGTYGSLHWKQEVK